MAEVNTAFDVRQALDLIEPAVARYPKASMYELAADGFTTLFQQVVACLISVRTMEETTLPVCRRLFDEAPDAAAVVALGEDRILEIIRPATFSDRKAPQIVEIARRTCDEFGGTIPCDAGVVLSFHGIGPKCTNLALGLACGVPLVSVDIHVHRVVNRWGYVSTHTPEQTAIVLNQVVPDDIKVRTNGLLVPFGKHICTGTRPFCSTCPVREMCARVGVTSHR